MICRAVSSTARFFFLRLMALRFFTIFQGESFNLDHVVIHRTGVYVVERPNPFRSQSLEKTELFSMEKRF